MTARKPRRTVIDLTDYVKALVEAAPPLTAAQKARLAVLLSRRAPSGEEKAA